MTIENFPNKKSSEAYKINKPENLRPKFEALSAYTTKLANRINADYAKNITEQQPTEKLITSNGAINMHAFLNKEGGYLKKEEVRKDEHQVHNRQLEFSGAAYKYQNPNDQEQAVKNWQTKKQAQKPALFETAATVVFDKAFNDKFLIVKTSEFDDYENGVDNLIIDKETGNVVCAFDEVHGEQKFGRYEEKLKKIQNSARQGGKEIKYGLGYENNQLVKKHLTNIPVFCLSIEPAEFDNLLNGLRLNETDLSPAETTFLKNITEQLSQQKNLVKNLPNLNPQITKNLEAFDQSLDKLKAKLNSKNVPT